MPDPTVGRSECPTCLGNEVVDDGYPCPDCVIPEDDEWHPEPTIYTPGVLDDGINYDD